MHFYSYSESRIEELVSKRRRIQRVVFFAGLGLLLTSFLLMFYGLQGSPRPNGLWHTGFILLFVLGAQLIQKSWSSHKKDEKLRNHLAGVSATFTDEEVQIRYSKVSTRSLEWKDILRVEEPAIGGGLYLRSANRYRWLLIPKSLDDYDEIKGELARMEIPTAQKRIPTNAEEFLFVFLFCGTLISTAFVSNLSALGVIFVVAGLLVPTGIYVINANPDNRVGRWKTIVGVFIPVSLIALKIWFVMAR
jgi:hypothetical protein